MEPKIKIIKNFVFSLLLTFELLVHVIYCKNNVFYNKVYEHIFIQNKITFVLIYIASFSF